MRLGMMQPYFFPYLGYIALIAATDHWVVFDTAQYIRRGWVNRNRVLSSGVSGWKYVRVPVAKAPQTAAIREMQIDAPTQLQDSIMRQLDEYRCQQPPFYRETVDLLDSCLSGVPDHLTPFLVHCLQQTCKHLQIPFQPVLFSDMSVTIPDQPQPGDWALSTAMHLQAHEYINPPGGRELFAPAAFAQAGIRLTFLQHNLPVYSQGQADFLPGLSVIDTLMWNGREATRQMIDDYKLHTVCSSEAA